MNNEKKQIILDYYRAPLCHVVLKLPAIITVNMIYYALEQNLTSH